MIKQTGVTFDVYAKKLEEGITPEVEKADVEVMDPVAWATESHALAEADAYRDADGKEIKSGDRLGQEYIDHSMPVVDEQLTKAGVRLAEMLNGVFGLSSVAGDHID
ncbi:MAG: hypothetical protein IPJ41_05580 [Phycisphaerales bacterium]|nr:hypothetical protein [Phycisphaerales bacterium]